MELAFHNINFFNNDTPLITEWFFGLPTVVEGLHTPIEHIVNRFNEPVFTHSLRNEWIVPADINTMQKEFA